MVEDGTVVLVGATTENSSFELIAPLFSRARVLVFRPLDEAALEKLLARAEATEGKTLPLDADARASLIAMADGDGRSGLTLAEEVWRAARVGETFDTAALQGVVQRRAPIHDKKQDGHYNLISALHKSVRGSDPDAALYYFCRMLDAGEDPLYLAWRIVRMVVEESGLPIRRRWWSPTPRKMPTFPRQSGRRTWRIAEACALVRDGGRNEHHIYPFGAAIRTARKRACCLAAQARPRCGGPAYAAAGVAVQAPPTMTPPEVRFPARLFPGATRPPSNSRSARRGFEREIRKRLEYWAKLPKSGAAHEGFARAATAGRRPQTAGRGTSRHGKRDQRGQKRSSFRHPERAERRPKQVGNTNLHSENPKSSQPGFVRGAGPGRACPSRARPQRAEDARERAHAREPRDDGHKTTAVAAAMPTSVQTVTVTADETGMRVDRFLEAKFQGLSFSHIQRVIRKGEVRVNGKRTQPKHRLEAGQAVRIPPLRLDAPKPRGPGNDADAKTRDFLHSIILHEDADVLVFNKPMGLAVQGGSGTTRHLDGMLEVLRDSHGQRPRLVHRLDKDTAGCLLVAKTRFAAAALAKTFRSRSARKIYGRWSPACRRYRRAVFRLFSPKRSGKTNRSCASPATAKKAQATR